jgi:hypothetical protein
LQLSLRSLAFAFVVAFASVSSANEEATSVQVWSGGEVSAYHDTDAVNVLTPAIHVKAKDPLAGWSLDAGYLVDVVSAASVDIVSTASPNWVELRHAATLGGRYQPRDIGVGVAAAVSSEPDYLSLVGSGTLSWDFARKNATLELGYGYGHDVAGRTGTPSSVYSLDLDRHMISAGLVLVLDRATTFTPSVDLVLESGQQEKPYRYLPLFSAGDTDSVPAGASVEQVNALRLPARVAENVPDTRQRYALSGRLSHRFRRSTLTLFDRVYTDSWGMLASTSDLRYLLELDRRFSIWPHARVHLQSGVSFWRRAYVGRVASGSVVAPEYRTGDRELGPLATLTAGPGARWDIGAGEPRNTSLILELDVSHTRYPDAFYVERRWAGFGLLQLEAKLP